MKKVNTFIIFIINLIIPSIAIADTCNNSNISAQIRDSVKSSIYSSNGLRAQTMNVILEDFPTKTLGQNTYIKCNVVAPTYSGIFRGEYIGVYKTGTTTRTNFAVLNWDQVASLYIKNNLPPDTTDGPDLNRKLIDMAGKLKTGSKEDQQISQAIMGVYFRNSGSSPPAWWPGQ